MRVRRVAAVVALLLASSGLPATANGPIRVLEAVVENRFPEQLAFRLRVKSDAAEIRQVQLVFARAGATSRTVMPVEVPTEQSVEAEFVWKTLQQSGVPPGAPIIYHWSIVDAAGNRLQTPEQTVYCDDVRHAWRMKSAGLVTVLWYEGDDEFGQALLDAAVTAVERLAGEAGITLSLPVRVVVYADVETFQSAYLATKQWAGGLSHPEMGLTVQAIPPTRSEVIPEVIPHEISHLVFYQATHHAYSDPPAWLNEGLAVSSELRSHEYEMSLVAQAARRGQLHSLAALGGGFPPDPQEARLAYAESYAIVQYIVETYGRAGLTALLDAFRQGSSREEAIQTALGVSPEELEAGWRAWAVALDEASGETRSARLRRPVRWLALLLALACCGPSVPLVVASAVIVVLAVIRRGRSERPPEKV